MGSGDYPDLECVNENYRDPWQDYDCYPDFYNYNEARPFSMDSLLGYGSDPNALSEFKDKKLVF